MAAWLGAVYGVLPRKIWVPHCRVSCGNPSIGGLADRRQQPVQSNRTFRLSGKPNRFESRIGMHYPAARVAPVSRTAARTEVFNARPTVLRCVPKNAPTLKRYGSKL